MKCIGVVERIQYLYIHIYRALTDEVHWNRIAYYKSERNSWDKFWHWPRGWRSERSGTSYGIFGWYCTILAPCMVYIGEGWMFGITFHHSLLRNIPSSKLIEFHWYICAKLIRLNIWLNISIQHEPPIRPRDMYKIPLKYSIRNNPAAFCLSASNNGLPQPTIVGNSLYMSSVYAQYSLPTANDGYNLWDRAYKRLCVSKHMGMWYVYLLCTHSIANEQWECAPLHYVCWPWACRKCTIQ